MSVILVMAVDLESMHVIHGRCSYRCSQNLYMAYDTRQYLCVTVVSCFWICRRKKRPLQSRHGSVAADPTTGIAKEQALALTRTGSSKLSSGINSRALSGKMPFWESPPTKAAKRQVSSSCHLTSICWFITLSTYAPCRHLSLFA